jgi:uncharacterized protein with PIN domain
MIDCSDCFLTWEVLEEQMRVFRLAYDEYLRIYRCPKCNRQIYEDRS